VRSYLVGQWGTGMQEIGITKSPKLQRFAVVALGWVLILFGIVGLVLPVVPGAVLTAFGVLMVNPQCVWLRRMLEKCQVRFPVLRRISPILERCNSKCENESKMRQETRPNVDEADTLCSSRNVLIFDEDIEDLARHAEPFEAHGFDVHKCMSVEAAMRSVEREEFDFALVDQGSSAFEGRRVIRHLIRYNAYTPFVVVARPKEMVWRQQALALRATEYLEKPVPRADMDRIIKCYFGNSLTK
jgi:ActR/RegA family two-component response regulator